MDRQDKPWRSRGQTLGLGVGQGAAGTRCRDVGLTDGQVAIRQGLGWLRWLPVAEAARRDRHGLERL